MILAIIGFFILLFFVGAIIACGKFDDAGFGLSVASVFGFLIALVALVCLIVGERNLRLIDDKIAMYQEENANIEAQISEAVQKYQEYETEIFTDVSKESAITLIALYPELKADTLVQAQIEVYIANNEKIKELKEKKIDGRNVQWWLYFGGGE